MARKPLYIIYLRAVYLFIEIYTKWQEARAWFAWEQICGLF